MSIDGVVRWVHLLAAAVWVGGSITVGALMPALRKAGADRDLLRAGARQFGRVAWVAITVSVVTGLVQWERLDVGGSTAFTIKMTLVTLAVLLAVIHQWTAPNTTPAVRGALQGVILLDALAIVAAAVAL